MIADKLDAQLDWLARAVKRGNGDLHDISLKVLDNMRAEVDRVRELETSGVIVMPEAGEARHGEAR